MHNDDPTLEEAKKQLADLVAEDEQEEKEKAQEAEKEGEFDVDKAVEQFDVMRAARKDALDKVEELLSKSTTGQGLDKEETLTCIRALHIVTYMQDMLITSLMGDLIRSIRSMAKAEIESFNTTAKLFTVSQALYQKGLVTQEEMEEIHQKVTVPQMLANLQVGEGKKKKED